jgi:hypothetical protein
VGAIARSFAFVVDVSDAELPPKVTLRTASGEAEPCGRAVLLTTVESVFQTVPPCRTVTVQVPATWKI